MNKLESVVVGALLGEQGEAPIRAGFALAQGLAARVDLVHVLPGADLLAGGMSGEWAGGVVWEQLRRDTKTQLEDMAKSMAAASGLKGSVCVEQGPPHRVLAEAAEQHAAALLVVGAHRASAAGGPLLGSTAERVVRKVECPVLVVRDDCELPPRRVLVPVDLSPACGASIEAGMRLLRRGFVASQALEIEVVFVLSNLQRELGLQFDSEQMTRFARLELERFAETHLHCEPWPVKCRVLFGDAAEQLLAEIAREPVDLVMMGTHGRSGFERWMMGSIASRMLRSAPASVLVVPPAREHELAVHAPAAWSTGADCFYFG